MQGASDDDDDDDSKHVISDDSHCYREARHIPPSHGPVKSVDGWNVFVRGLNEGTGEADLIDTFSSYGRIQIVRLNRDRRTGSARCAIVEFLNYREAQNAINALHGCWFLDRRIGVHWAFVNPTAGRGDYT